MSSSRGITTVVAKAAVLKASTRRHPSCERIKFFRVSIVVPLAGSIEMVLGADVEPCGDAYLEARFMPINEERNAGRALLNCERDVLPVLGRSEWIRTVALRSSGAKVISPDSVLLPQKSKITI